MGRTHHRWWWRDPLDTKPQGEPETVVFLPNREQLEGLYIRGLETDLMLGVRVNPHGDPISCAITIELDLPAGQSNPRRDYSDDGA